MGLQVSKTVILPRIDKIEDPEVKRVFQQMIKAIRDLNTIYYSDLTGLEKRIVALEP